MATSETAGQAVSHRLGVDEWAAVVELCVVCVHVRMDVVLYGYSSSQCNIATSMRKLTCYMVSHCVACHPAGDIPAFTLAEAGTRFSDSAGMQV